MTTGSLDDRRMPVPLWMFRVLLLHSQNLGPIINFLAIVGQSCLVAQS
jgi:hypothetical protein